MGATILNNAKIGNNCLVGAGALVTENKEFPDGMLIIGSPAKAVRELSPEMIKDMTRSSKHYVCLLYTSPSPRDLVISRMPSSA